MSDPKDFVAALDSDARRTPRRIAFITKRTSPQAHVKDEDRVMTYPEAFFRAAVAIEVLAIALILTSLLWNAPLEGLANPMHTPIRQRRLGTFSAYRSCCITSHQWLPAFSFPAWWSWPSSSFRTSTSTSKLKACGCATRAESCGSSASWSWRSVFSWQYSMSGSLWFPRSWLGHSCYWQRESTRRRHGDFDYAWCESRSPSGL